MYISVVNDTYLIRCLLLSNLSAASLWAELAVERQMVEQTRQQLAVARTAQRSNHLPRPVAVTLPVTSKGSDIASISEIEYPHLPKKSSK